MPVRVRKLARDLERTPAQVLGLLHALGFPRYKSSEDQLADPVAAKVRAAVRVGLKADPVEPEAERRERAPEAVGGGAGGMAALVPGVVPLGQKAPVKATKPAEPPVAGRAPARPPAGTVAPEPSSGAERDALVVQRDALVAERDALKAERALLVAQRDALTAERDAARAERDALITAQDATARREREQRAAPAGASGAGALLEERGLRGRDEHARALSALLRERWLEVDALGVVDAAPVRAALRERLVLVDGDPPEPLAGVVGVSVSPDRAEIPGAREVARRFDRLGELLLLHGWRRIRVVGAPVRWHGLLRARFDPRIELSIVPGGPRDAERAARDVDGVEVVWLWGTTGDAGARDAWGRAKLLIDGPEGLAEATVAARQALERL